MITLTVEYGTSGRDIRVQVDAIVSDLKGLNMVLANRLADELKDHFVAKDSTPNKLGGTRSNFWKDLAANTAVAEVTDAGAVITVADERLAIHIHGGTVLPKTAEALTIPVIKEAYGLRALTYEQQFKTELFTIPNVPLLFEKVAGGGNQSLARDTEVQSRARNSDGGAIYRKSQMARRTEIRPVYYLAKSVVIPRDPRALPNRRKVEIALQEEGDDWIARKLSRPS